MTTLQDLISRGYFPVELPPPFTSQQLAYTVPALMPNITSYSPRTSKTLAFDIPRVKHQRRHLGIPNPLHQIRLSNAIVDNWTDISTFTNQSNISLSSLAIGTRRAIKTAYNFDELPMERALRSTGARVMLKTDISRFYPTIYTHSIPWAIHTKATAKRIRNNTLYGNLLDECIRNCQDGQTIGIPIGPDTSLVIAEIMGTALDLPLQQEFPDIKGFRYIDDYYLYFDSISDAESCFSKLIQILKSFELDGNHIKTSITMLPETLEKQWAYELRLYDIRSNISSQKTDIIHYFSKAYEYANIFQSDPVLKYALKRTKSFNIDPNNWSIFEALLLRTMIDEPSVLPVATEILLSYDIYGYPIDRIKISETITKIVGYHLQYNHTFEVAWALWLAKSLNIRIESTLETAIANNTNSIVALIALDLYTNGQIGTLNTGIWRSILTVNELNEDQWLLAYEAKVKGWLTPIGGARGYGAGTLFAEISNHNVEFYDSNRQVNTFTPPKETITLPQTFGFGGGYY